MSRYFAGVDLGTTFAAAAVARDGRPEMVSLGAARAAIPSVVLLRKDETITVGEPALQRGRATPDRLARQFKRRIGDPTPIVLGGTPMDAHRLLGRLLRWTLGQDAEIAINAVEAVLGPASFDDGFQPTANGFEICLGTQIRFVTFGESLFLTSSDAATPFNDAGDAFRGLGGGPPTDFEEVAGVGPGDRFRDLTAAHPFFEQFFDELRGFTIMRVGDAGGGEITYAFDVTNESGVLPGSVITDMSAGVNVCGE